MDRSGAAQDEAAPTRCRLVLYGSRPGLPEAGVFPVDATPYTQPLFTFRLRPDQELPAAEPGAVAEVEGLLAKGEQPRFTVAGVTIEPPSPLGRGRREGTGRMFAERGEVVAHPAVAGTTPTWRHVTPASFDALDAWRRRLRRATWVWWLNVAVLAVLGPSAVRQLYLPRSWFLLAAALAVLPATFRAWRRARRGRAALEQAASVRHERGRPVRLTIRWLVGHGDGPVAVAHLAAPETGAEVAALTVVNVPTALAGGEPVDAEVLGDPAAGVSLIRVGDELLWPEGTVLDGAEPQRVTG